MQDLPPLVGESLARLYFTVINTVFWSEVTAVVMSWRRPPKLKLVRVEDVRRSSVMDTDVSFRLMKL